MSSMNSLNNSIWVPLRVISIWRWNFISVLKLLKTLILFKARSSLLCLHHILKIVYFAIVTIMFRLCLWTFFLCVRYLYLHCQSLSWSVRSLRIVSIISPIRSPHSTQSKGFLTNVGYFYIRLNFHSSLSLISDYQYWQAWKKYEFGNLIPVTSCFWREICAILKENVSFRWIFQTFSLFHTNFWKCVLKKNRWHFAFFPSLSIGSTIWALAKQLQAQIHTEHVLNILTWI